MNIYIYIYMHLGQVKLFIYLGKAHIDDLMIFKVERFRQAPYQCFREYNLVTYSAGVHFLKLLI